jgi:DNA-binding CsgD family transcriptional regulator
VCAALVEAQGLRAVVTTVDLRVVWTSPGIGRLAASAMGRPLRQLVAVDATVLTDLARVASSGTPATRSLPSGQRMHVVDRTGDPAIGGLLWWWRDESRPADPEIERLELLRDIVERFTAELTWGGFVGATPTPAFLRAFGSVESLSAREREILDLLTKGLRVPSIAARVYISASTVRNHLSTAFKKIGVTSQAEFFERLAAAESAPG